MERKVFKYSTCIAQCIVLPVFLPVTSLPHHCWLCIIWMSCMNRRSYSVCPPVHVLRAHVARSEHITIAFLLHCKSSISPHRATWWTSTRHVTEYSYSRIYRQHDGVWRRGRVAPLILKVGTRREWSASCSPRAGKEIRKHTDEESVSGEEKNILHRSKIEPLSFGCL
jgi:hypothetical protein